MSNITINSCQITPQYGNSYDWLEFLLVVIINGDGHIFWS